MLKVSKDSEKEDSGKMVEKEALRNFPDSGRIWYNYSATLESTGGLGLPGEGLEDKLWWIVVHLALSTAAAVQHRSTAHATYTQGAAPQAACENQGGQKDPNRTKWEGSMLWNCCSRQQRCQQAVIVVTPPYCWKTLPHCLKPLPQNFKGQCSSFPFLIFCFSLWGARHRLDIRKQLHIWGKLGSDHTQVHGEWRLRKYLRRP